MIEEITRALAERESLLAALADEETNCYRLFHGASEGVPGLTVDRYGALLLVQTFREPLAIEAREAVATRLRDALGEGYHFVYNHRGKSTKASFDDWHQPPPEALVTMPCQEFGIRYLNRARHRGQDPMLYIDFRAARRALKQESASKSVLNLYAYTGTAGICAAVGGARDVWNVDFSASMLEWGRAQAQENDIPEGVLQWYQEDVFPMIRQLADLPLKGRARHKGRLTRFAPRQFDIVVLDPPTWSKSRWGAVDLVRDYQSMLKPALFAVADGGLLLATNHAAGISRDAWLEQVARCAIKAGRPFRSIEALSPEADFPGFAENPLLKMALCRV